MIAFLRVKQCKGVQMCFSTIVAHTAKEINGQSIVVTKKAVMMACWRLDHNRSLQMESK
jgi:hypothetical protein